MAAIPPEIHALRVGLRSEQASAGSVLPGTHRVAFLTPILQILPVCGPWFQSQYLVWISFQRVLIPYKQKSILRAWQVFLPRLLADSLQVQSASGVVKTGYLKHLDLSQAPVSQPWSMRSRASGQQLLVVKLPTDWQETFLHGRTLGDTNCPCLDFTSNILQQTSSWCHDWTPVLGQNQTGIRFVREILDVSKIALNVLYLPMHPGAGA